MADRYQKEQVISSFFWKFLERAGTQGIQFVVQIVLARLLLPGDYGIIALALVFISIANVFVQSGFSTALIQKKDTDRIDFSSVFFISLSVALTLYFLIFIFSPLLGDFYQIPEIVPVFRVLSITIIFGAFHSVQDAIIAKNLQFKKLFFSNTGALLVSGSIGIYLAYAGYGVWALVFQQLSNHLLVTLILWCTVKWRPDRIFSLNRVKGLFSYGSKLLASALIDTVYTELNGLVIGKLYDSNVLGLYNRGQQFPSVIGGNIDGTIQTVMFPVLADQQDDSKRAKTLMRRAVVSSSFVVFPAMIGLAVAADSIVRVLLTDVWLPSVPFIQIYCVIYAMRPIHTANLQAINAMGRSDIFLKLEIIKKIIGLIILLIAAFYGIYAIAFGGVISSLIATFINTYPNKKLLDYSYREQLGDVLPSLVLSIVMGAVVLGVKLLSWTPGLTLLAQLSIGFIVYFGLAWFFRLECLDYLMSALKGMFSGRIKGG